MRQDCSLLLTCDYDQVWLLKEFVLITNVAAASASKVSCMDQLQDWY